MGEWNVNVVSVVLLSIALAEQRTTILWALQVIDNCFTKIGHSEKFALVENFAHLGGANNIVLLSKNNNDDNANT